MGNALEIIATEDTDRDCLVVIHAMGLRKQYYYLLGVININYNEIDVERIVDEVVTAEEQGKLRNATKQETMIVRLAALSAIVRKMQALVENDKELIGV